MTFAEGVTLGIIGTTITLISLAIAYYFGPDSKKKDEEEKERKRFKKIYSWWN